MIVIYGLRDPNTGWFCYVGQTMHSPKTRLQMHQYIPTDGMRPWFKALKDTGKEPEIVILETVIRGYDGDTPEIEWIRKLREEGHPLLNVHRVYNKLPWRKA